MKKCNHEYSTIICNQETSCLKCGAKISYKQLQYEALTKEFISNGFSEKQSIYMINFLNNYLPIV